MLEIAGYPSIFHDPLKAPFRPVDQDDGAVGISSDLTNGSVAVCSLIDWMQSCGMWSLKIKLLNHYAVTSCPTRAYLVSLVRKLPNKPNICPEPLWTRKPVTTGTLKGILVVHDNKN